MMATIMRFPNYTDMAAGIALKQQMPYQKALEIVADRIRRKINATSESVPLYLARGLETVEERISEVKSGKW